MRNRRGITDFLNHPRVIEWIGVPQSAGLIELSGRQWVDKLSRDQAVTAAVHLQRDVGLMQTNVDVLHQYAYWYVGGDYGFTPYNYVTCKNVMSSVLS